MRIDRYAHKMYVNERIAQDGSNVVVKKVNEFSSTILPKYFKHKNFNSFLRQLNMYGFHTARQGTFMLMYLNIICI